MATTITISGPPAGYVTAPGYGGEKVGVSMKEFVSSEDGNLFVTRLEGVSIVLAALFGPNRVSPACVETLLAVIRPTGETTVSVNDELSTLALVRRTKRTAVSAGEALYLNDIAEIEEVEFRDSDDKPIQIPDDCGVVLVLSHGWRKGLYYDYSVFPPHGRPRADHLPRLFGHFLTRLMFQEMYSVTDEQWNRLLSWGWFPFIGLGNEGRRKLLGWATHDRDPGPVLEELCRDFATGLDARMESWKHLGHLNDKMDFLTRARERFEAGDYVSCINVLFPQIEGVMRTLFVNTHPAGKAGQGSMVTTLVARHPEHTVLLPNRFKEFLSTVYFRDFDERAGIVPLSRHTVAHGVSRASDYSFARAAVGFMMLDQLFHYLSN